MATSAGEIEIALSLAGEGFKKSLDGVEKQISGFSKSAKNLGTTLAGVFSAKAIFDFGKASLMAFADQEAAVVKLNQALANQGRYSAQASKDLLDYADALAQTTVYSDESIVSVQAQLTAFGMQGKQLKDVTKATLDLASAKGIDLQSAAQMLGKAFAGETTSLGKLGITIDESIPKGERFAALLGKVNGAMGGQAEKERQTTIGQIKAMGNTFNELQETIGGLIAGPATAIMSWLSSLANKVKAAIETIRDASNDAGGFFKMLVTVGVFAISELVRAFVAAHAFVADKIFAFLEMIPGAGAALKLIGVDVEAVRLTVANAFAGTEEWITKQGQNLTLLAGKWVSTTNTAVGGEKKKGEASSEYHNQVQEDIATTTAVWEEATAAQGAAWEKYQASLHAGQKIWTEVFFTSTEEMAKWFASTIDSMFSSFGQAMADVIVDSKDFSEALKGVWKGLIKSLISMLIELIAKLIVAVALKSALGLGGASMAEVARNVMGLQKLTGKGGMATGGIISEPSVLTGLKSGKSHLVGESGAEAVVPLGGNGENKSASEMGMDFSGGGGGINLTVNISGEFIEGDENKWGRLFRERILPEIKRATMTNPTGNFIRRRGATA